MTYSNSQKLSSTSVRSQQVGSTSAVALFDCMLDNVGTERERFGERWSHEWDCACDEELIETWKELDLCW